MARLEAHRVAVAPINRVGQALAHPQVLPNDMVVDVGSTRLVGTPFKMAQGGGVAPVPPRALGADTDAVLRNRLGMDAAEIAALRASSVVR